MKEWNKWLHRACLAGLFLFLFTPLIVTTSILFPYITGKAFFFRILVEILFAFWLFLVLIDPQYRPRRSWLLIALSVFIVVVALATIFGENLYKSFWSNYERMEGLISYLHLFVYFLILVSVMRTEKLWQWFFHLSLVANTLVALYGLFQLLGKIEISSLSGARVDATLGNATYVAGYMLVHIFLAGWLMLRHWRISWSRYIYAPIILLQLVILYATATRGAILGFISGLFLFALLFAVWERRNPTVKRAALGILAAVIVAVGVFWLARDSDFIQKNPVLSRFAKISLTEQTTEARLTVWQMSLKGFRERPILGWGPENFMLVFNKYYEPKLWPQEPWFDRSHNIFLDWLISAGLFGLLGYLSLFLILFYYLWRPRFNFTTAEKSLFSGLLAAYFFNNIFVFDNLISYLFFFSFLGYVHYRVTKDKTEPVTQPSRWYLTKDNSRLAAAVLILLILLPALYYLNLRPLSAGRKVVLAITPASGGMNLKNFRQALSYGGFGASEISEQLVRVALAAPSHYEDKSGRKTLNLLKNEAVSLALQQLEKLVPASPQDARLRLLYGTFLVRVGAVEQGINELEKVQALSPRKQAVLFELASAHLTKGDKKKALEIAASAYGMDQRYPEARTFYALMAIYAGQSALLKEILQPEDYPLEDRFINAYADLKEYGKVLSLWQERVKNEPANTQHRFSLAAAYFMNSERARAIAELEEAARLDPRVKEQAEQVIREIRAGRNPLKE